MFIACDLMATGSLHVTSIMLLPAPEQSISMESKSRGGEGIGVIYRWAAVRGVAKSDTTSLSLSLFTFMRWRRKWQPTPVFLPGESQGRGSLMGCRLWGRTESDTTEAT